ncbi:heat shock 70 kDa protein 12A-like [Dreissena polymorpha]|uniref:heat shock 70 kDa protein 12A-like n=1 Tax=Dreissena polymorpha TaxID=45954 RepID=UPI0022653B24|nr:heat shock 70 kDa protein 12A-like [Dreissena polymorpha]
MATSGGPLVVAAIDFGTTYSGWAFSFKHDFEREPCKVSAKALIANQLASQKAPTCVLIKPDGKTLDAFGFDAETRYSQLCETGEHKQWYYFQRFKMMLWDKLIHKDTLLDDEFGKSLKALTVFALSIRYMKEDLSSMSKNQVSGMNQEDIHWVLTVPAIWNDSAKHFMRLAAEEAGISSQKLTIALEPEVASIYCKHLQVTMDGEGGVSSFRPGKKYIVLDAGGGTIDITTHEVCFGGELKELYKATGGAWGGTLVDKDFLDFVSELAGKETVERFKEEHMEDYLDLMRDFEMKKRSTRLSSKGRVTIKIPLTLMDLISDIKGRSLKQIVSMSQYANKAELTGEKLRLEDDVFRSFFKTSVSETVKHLTEVLRKHQTRGVEAILMVGGFSESPLLIETIRNEFSRLQVIIPPDAGLAVLKGAVIFGHCPTSIKERVSKYTYGTNKTTIFDEKKHPEEKRKIHKSGEPCDEC